jgi:hypothetical protein
MTDKQPASGPQVEATKEIDRIRDIIFGHEMRDYDQRFQTVKRDLERLQQEIDRLTERLEEQDREQDKKTQNLRQEMRQSDTDLRDELRHTAERLVGEKVDRVSLGELFVEVGNHLKTGSVPDELLEGLREKLEAGSTP